MKRVWWLVLVAAWAGSVRAEGVDEEIARTSIPSSNNVHGEVRLLRVDGAACVQTILYSKYLRRGVHEMRNEEMRCWPEGGACHADSAAYLDALTAATSEAVRENELQATPGAATDERQKLMIEFSLAKDFAGYSLYHVDIAGEPGQVEITGRRLIATKAADPAYVSRAMVMMAGKAFHVDPSDATRLLAGIGWWDAGAAAP